MQRGGDNKRFPFPKEERICSKKTLETLLSNKQQFFAYPFKCYYQFLPFEEGTPSVQIAIAIPKRTVKSAVTRNRIKRMVREVYRLQNKMILSPVINKKIQKIVLLFVFYGSEIPSYQLVEEKIIMLLSKIANETSDGKG